MKSVLEYLRIPGDYDGNRYSLNWSPSGDAVLRPDGSTFAMAGQIALFLEGFALVGSLVHFSYVLYMLERFDSKLDESEEPGLPRFGHGRELVDRSELLAQAFQTAGRPHRNAGALCAWLCREVPPLTTPPDVADVCFHLVRGSVAPNLYTRMIIQSVYQSADSPPLTALDFDIRFLNALRKLTPEEIQSWLEHGRPNLPPMGERVAEMIEAVKPKTLEGVLAALEDRERLAGAMPLVSQFLSALSLPPRRLAYQALPTGGYSDIATRGRPEQILPSQFAIDDIEFLRRFAENELLYFHREEPHAPLTDELILVLDQGVRTWGKVRHALAASALALSKLSIRRKLRLLLASTSQGGKLVDPLAVTEETLGAFWEASDLSPNPAQTLEAVLESPHSTRRDLIVLTHPRNVAEPEFAASARLLDDSTRLFSVTIDEPGAVQFREWKRGVPVKLADFRVDFTTPASKFRKKPSTVEGPDPRGWRGDVEPVPFPFRFGVTHRIDRPLFDFDESGRWLLLCTHRGMLHAWKVDGSTAEILPRGMMVDGSIFEQVDAILGVADGFVAAGRVGKILVAMHYDLRTRTARAYTLGPTFDGEWNWFYFRSLHTIVAKGKDYSRAIDLANREIQRSRESKERPSIRAIQAFEMASNFEIPPPGLPIAQNSGTPEKGPYVSLDRKTGTIHLDRVAPSRPPFVPRADGKPMLKDCWIDHAQWRGNVLALVVSGPDRPTLLRLYRFTDHPRPEAEPGIVTRELTSSSSEPSSLILSQDGRLLARRLGERQVEVRETTGDGRAIFTTVKGKSHTDPKVTLGRYGLVIHVGKHVNLIRWDREKLTVSTVAEGSTRSEHDVVTWPLDRPAMRSTPMPRVLDYDPHRFVACARAELTAVVDVFGQVSLFDRKERLIAMFVAFRSQVAAWMPDGTRFGPSQGTSPLIDGPATRNAAEIIGRALKEASEVSLTSWAEVKATGSR